MAADNNVDPAAVADLNELIDAGVPEQAEVLALVDRTAEARYGRSEIHGIGWFSDTRLLRITSAGPEVVDAWGEADTSDPGTLRAFVRTAADHPAERRAIVLWDHGNVNVYGTDEEETARGAPMTVEEIAWAFRRDALDPAGGYHTFDLVAFNACLMSSLAALKALAPLAPILVASAEVMPGAGLDHAGLMAAMRLPDLTPRELARRIVRDYEAYYVAHPEQTLGLQVTLTAWETDVDLLGDAIKAVGDGILAVAESDPRTQLEFAAANTAAFVHTTEYGRMDPFGSAASVDFGEYLGLLADDERSADARQAARRAVAAIEGLRIAHAAPGRPRGLTGLSGGSSSSEGTSAVGQAIQRIHAMIPDYDGADPEVSLELGAVQENEQGSPVVPGSVYASDDTFLGAMQRQVYVVLDDVLLLTALAVQHEGVGEPDYDGEVEFPLWGLAILPEGAAAPSRMNLASMVLTADQLVVPLRLQVGANDLAAAWYVDRQDRTGFAVQSPSGPWAVLPAERLASAGARVAPVQFAIDRAAGEMVKVTGTFVDLAASRLVPISFRDEQTVALFLAYDLAGNTAEAAVEVQ